MKIIRFKVHLGIGYAGAYHEDTLHVEVDDDATFSEIEGIKQILTTEWANNYIDLSFGENLTDI